MTNPTGEPIPGTTPNPPESGQSTPVWRLSGPPVNTEFVSRLVAKANQHATDGGEIGAGSFISQDGKRFSVEMQMGTDHDASPERKQYLDARLIVKGDGLGSLDLRHLGELAKQYNLGYFDEQTYEQTKNWGSSIRIEHVILTNFRDLGVELHLRKNHGSETGIDILFGQYPRQEDSDLSGVGFYDSSTNGAIDATDKVRNITPIALETIFLLNGNPIKQGQISTHPYVSIVDEINQLTEIEQQHGNKALVRRSPTGEWLVSQPETVNQESKSDTGKEGLDAIFGQDVAVKKFRGIIDAMTDPHYQLLDAMPNLGVLLFGPPGTGKTSVAKAAAAELGANIFILDSREVQTSFIGVAGKSITDRLESVLKYVQDQKHSGRKAVLLIDEIDALAPQLASPNLGGTTLERAREQTTAFKNLLEQLVDNGNILVIGTTNLREDVDPAIRSRLGEEIPMFPPDEQTAAQYAQSLVDTKVNRIPAKLRPTVEIDYSAVGLAAVKAGFVQRDIRKIIMETWHQAAHNHLREKAGFTVTTDKILEVVSAWTRGNEMETKQKGPLGFHPNKALT